jgi:cytochrome P450
MTSAAPARASAGLSSEPVGLPPGPRGPVLTETVRFHRHPLAVLRRCRDTYGDVFTLRLALPEPTVVVAAPEAATALVETDRQRANAGEGRRDVVPMAAARSVFGGDGDVHRTARGRLAAAFAPEAIGPRQDAIRGIAERHLAEWPRGRPIQLLSRMRTLVDDVFVRQLLGVGDEERARATVDALGAMLRTPGNPPFTLPGRKSDGPLGAAGRAIFAQRKARLEGLLREEVEARRGRESGFDDVIGCMLAGDPPASTEEILEELVTLLLAAQEPPSIALTWTLDRLARHPELAADYLAAGDGAPLRDAVLRETLRLRSPALASLRVLREPFQAGPHLLPAGTATMVPLPLVHRDPRLFPAPERFRPQRWLETDSAPPLFLPFGGGVRRCLGEALALAEVAAIVPAVLATVRLRPLWPREERQVLRGTVLVPHRSVPVLVG